jgi:hypothetical protein
MAHLAPRQQRTRRSFIGLPSFPVTPQAHGTPLSLPAVISSAVKRRDAGIRQRLGLFDGQDCHLGMGRTQEQGAKPLRSQDIMDIATATDEEAPIFPAAKRYPNPILGVAISPRPSCITAAPYAVNDHNETIFVCTAPTENFG